MQNHKSEVTKKLLPSFFSRLQSALGIATLTKSKKRNRTTTNVAQYSVLEPKNLLASVSFSGGVITINGTAADDQATVAVSGDYVGVAQPGFDTESFVASSVNSIVFIGRAGDDFFANTTSIPNSAFGQAGNDTLIGGSGLG